MCLQEQQINLFNKIYKAWDKENSEKIQTLKQFSLDVNN